MPHIRPIAICLFHHYGKILVSEEHDPTENETFYRPLGGGIEFGEHSTEAIHREIDKGRDQRGSKESGLSRHIGEHLHV